MTDRYRVMHASSGLNTRRHDGRRRAREAQGVGEYRVTFVTPRVTKILIKLLKMQLSLKTRANQAVEVAN
jgi:hypothetical protein